MYLPFAIVSFILNGVAVTIDKFLLTKIVPDPLFYVFYFSLMSTLALLGLPFTKIPSVEVFLLASTSTLLWTLGAYCMFQALKIGQVQRVIPIVGTLNPIILFVISLFFGTITNNQIWAILVLILGLLSMIIFDLKGKLTLKEVIFELSSATLFAISYLLLKEAYNGADFATVFIWSRFILIPIAIIFLVIPTLRHKVLPKRNNQQATKKGGLLFLIGQTCGALSQLLFSLAISLGNPAIVNSMQGIQYVFLFIVAIIFAKKYPSIFVVKTGLISFGTKLLGIVLIGVGLFLLSNS